MSRFFHGGLSDSDTSSSDEDLYSEEEEEEASVDESGSEDESDEAEKDDDDDAGQRFLSGMGGGDDSSDEEDGRRIVKSAKDKRLEEIEGSIKLIENGEKINDWVLISGGGYNSDFTSRCSFDLVWCGEPGRRGCLVGH